MLNFLYSNCILVIEQKISAQFKANQGIGILFFQSVIFDSNITIQHGKLAFRFLNGGTMLFFLVGQVAVGLDHQVDILFHLRPFQDDFLMVGVMVKFQPLPVVIYKTPAAVQKIVGVPTESVLLCQRFGTEIAVGLGLVQCHNALFTAHKS